MKAKPLIVASLSDVDIRQDILEIVSMSDIIELRVDMFERRGLNEIKQVFTDALTLIKKPIIGTVRDVSEGGFYRYEDRLSIYLCIEEFCKYVDIELSHNNLITTFKQLHKNQDLKLIGSYHNFEETPDYPVLKRILEQGKMLNVDIIKIAVTSNTKEDVTRLLKFTDNNRERQIIALSMGELGRDSRVIGGLYGSVMTYGYVINKTAPGQIFIPELRREIDLLYS